MRTDGSHMHVHNNQAAEREVSQPARANQRSRGMKKRRVGRHLPSDGSHMHVHNNQAAERGGSQPVRANQRSGGMQKRSGRPARAV